MRWLAPAFALGVFATALVALAPATLADPFLARASNGRLRLAEAQGSLWSGSGWIEVRDAEGRAGVARRLAWRMLPAALLRASLVAEIQFDQAAKPFPVTLSLSRIDVADAAIDLPATALGLGLPRLAPFRLSGDLRVDIPHMSFGRDRVDGDARLQWRGAGSALTPVSPLGAYEMRFKASGPGMQVSLSTLEGPLQLDGNGTLSNSAPPSFVGTARVPAQNQEQLVPLFRLFAVERGAGIFELRLP